jgi:A/G-specific adenine glycosylase
LLDVLRAAHAPVPVEELDAAWDDAVQRSRCLYSLLTDGLVDQTHDGLFTLPQS